MHRVGRKVVTNKGGETKTRILETALEMFQQRGYEKTTMRAIAEGAGVSLGNAYYYFHSKEQLIQAFYHRTHEEHTTATQSAMAANSDLKARLLEVIRLKISTLEPYHQFAGVLFKTAADPHSPLNPFSEESDAVRQESIQLFAQLVDESASRIPADLKAELPYLLWVFHMGIILFWIHDSSPKHKRTYRLIDHTVDLVARLVSLASNPLMSPLRKRALRLVADVRDAAGDTTSDEDQDLESETQDTAEDLEANETTP